MRASFSSAQAALRPTCLRILLICSLAAPALMLPMSNASAQMREIVEMDEQAQRPCAAGRKAGAIALAERSVEKSRTTLGAYDKTTGILTSQLGFFYREVGRYADAEKALKTAIPILERSRENPNFNLAQALNNLGGI